MSQFGSIIQKRILMVGDVDLRIEPNHRFFNVVECFSSRFEEADSVSCANAYGGAHTSAYDGLLSEACRGLYLMVKVGCSCPQMNP